MKIDEATQNKSVEFGRVVSRLGNKVLTGLTGLANRAAAGREAAI